jgi:hypothetical protein
MKPRRIDLPFTAAAWTLTSALFLIASGCHTPDAANIALRKENAALSSQIDTLNRRHDADVASIDSLQGKKGPTTMALPQERIERLFTTHGLAFGVLTGGYNSDNSDGPSDGLEIAVYPTDDQGSPLKAAGSFTIQAFDLADPHDPLIGTWNFPLQQSRDLFYSHLSMYTYILKCPWQRPPQHGDLTMRVTFDDELTGRRFTVDRPIHATLSPAATRP